MSVSVLMWVKRLTLRKSLENLLPPSFSGGSDGKVSAYNAGDLGSISRLGKYPGEGKGYPIQYSDLENFYFPI